MDKCNVNGRAHALAFLICLSDYIHYNHTSFVLVRKLVGFTSINLEGFSGLMYRFTSRVRYSEINYHTNALSPSSIINYFQDCSTFQSEDMNIGLAYLQEHNRVWLLNSWQLQMKRPVYLGENIIVETWPYDFQGFYGYRNFIMRNDREEVLVAANSIWVYVDTTTGHPTRIPEHTGYKLEPPFPLEQAKRKIALPTELIQGSAFTVKKSNIDSYNHVNNGQYIKMAEEYLPEDVIVTAMRVEYRRQAVLGDIIIPSISIQDKKYVIVLSNKDGLPYAITEFQIQ